MDLELKEIELAAKRLEPTIHRTKIESSKTFSDMTGGEIYLKFENQQKTGSFKIKQYTSYIIKKNKQKKSNFLLSNFSIKQFSNG